MDKLSPEQIFNKTFKYVFFRVLIPIASLAFSLIIMKVISAIMGGVVGWVGTLIWLIFTVGFAFGVEFFVGYKFHASHVAVVTDAVSVGVIADDMDAMAKELVEYRFPSCNDYLAYSRIVKGSIGQLQKHLNVFLEKKMSVPVLGQLIKLAQIFVGAALSFAYDLILGYTFWRDGKTLFTSASDGVAIYYNCWKRIAQNVLILAAELIGGMALLFIFTAAVFMPILAPTYGPLAGGLGGCAVGYFVCTVVKTVVDSRLMIKLMFPFFEEAQYADITEEEYNMTCDASPKYKKLYNKALYEAQTAPQQPQG